MKTTTILAMIACSCGSDPDYTTIHGLDVFDPEGLTSQLEVETATAETLTQCNGDVEKIDGMELTIVFGPRDGMAGGCDPGNDMWVCSGGEGNCRVACELPHELGHALQEMRDENHTASRWWGERGCTHLASLSLDSSCPFE